MLFMRQFSVLNVNLSPTETTKMLLESGGFWTLLHNNMTGIGLMGLLKTTIQGPKVRHDVKHGTPNSRSYRIFLVICTLVPIVHGYVGRNP